VSTVAQVFALAVQHHKAGDLGQAEQLYQRVLQADPNHADSHHLRGVVAYQQGRFDQAVACIHQALLLQPGTGPYYANLGLVHEAAGRVASAIDCYQRALQYQPNLAEANGNLANVLAREGRKREAVTHYQQALRLRRHYPEAHSGLGAALVELGQVDAGVPHLREALRLKPDFATAWGNLANALMRQEKLDEAIHCYQQVIRLKPDTAIAHNNMGYAFARQGNIDASLACYEQALKVDPKHIAAYYNLGNALERLSKLDDAVRNYRRAIELKPNFADAFNNLGSALLRQGFLDEAMSSFQEALRLDPQMATAQSNRLFWLNYIPQSDPDALIAECCQWGKLQEPATSPPSHTNDPDPERLLRIGYVSPDFRQHALRRYFEPVLEHHDRHRVHITCYAEVARPDAVTARLKNLADAWQWTVSLSDDQLAQRIRDDRIDILVDLAGHTGNNRLRVFALKPAPVQATWLGYLNTTGLSSMDYRITDEVLDPLSGVRCPVSGVKSDSSDTGLRTPDSGLISRDTEELLRLPGGMCCFAKLPDEPSVTPLPALRRGYLTFGSLHNLFKINKEVLDVWSELLKNLPAARLLIFRDSLTGRAQQRLVQEFAERGIGGERLDLRHSPSTDRYLEVYNEIDVSLDTFPVTGGVTTCESLWMGVPVISLCGLTPLARNSAALLHRVGLTDWIVHSTKEYLSLAAKLPQELDRLAVLRAELRASVVKALCDAEGFTRVLEDAYRTIWRRWCHQEASRLSSESAIYFRQVLQQNPNDAEACNSLGIVLTVQDKLQEAVTWLEKAVRIKPDHFAAHYNLANALARQTKLDEAVGCYRRALVLKPDSAQVHNDLGLILMRLGLVQEALESFREALRSQPDLATAQSNLLFCLNYDPQAEADAVYAEAWRWGSLHEPPAIAQDRGTSDSYPNDPSLERPLRIGYVSPDFRNHALASYFEPVLAHHDSQRVQVTCYAEVSHPDSTTRRLQNLAHDWRWTCKLTDVELARCIRNDRIDILVDLAGHSGNNRLPVFGHKPAPIQVNWLGYLNTTGLTRMDYRLTDEVLDPMSDVRCPMSDVRRIPADFGLRTSDIGLVFDTEELFRLPEGMCCFKPLVETAPVAPLPALNRGHLTFGSPHNLFKLNPQVFDLWSNVLNALPDSQLLLCRDTLTASARERISQEFGSRGVGSHRLHLHQRPNTADYLDVYNEIDVCLDSFPCTGGVTTCESLWMGVPVLTLCGMRPMGRNSAAILTRVGLADWVVRSPQEYLAKSVAVAKKLDDLARLRAGLREKVTATLCDAVRFTRILEGAYRTMWQRWCKGEKN
jgi:predicted O-linked N-acetylglucosamine transferase (SPINDLY family)